VRRLAAIALVALLVVGCGEDPADTRSRASARALFSTFAVASTNNVQSSEDSVSAVIYIVAVREVSDLGLPASARAEPKPMADNLANYWLPDPLQPNHDCSVSIRRNTPSSLQVGIECNYAEVPGRIGQPLISSPGSTR
jgi:hypothetical protein